MCVKWQDDFYLSNMEEKQKLSYTKVSSPLQIRFVGLRLAWNCKGGLQRHPFNTLLLDLQ